MLEMVDFIGLLTVAITVEAVFESLPPIKNNRLQLNGCNLFCSQLIQVTSQVTSIIFFDQKYILSPKTSSLSDTYLRPRFFPETGTATGLTGNG